MRDLIESLKLRAAIALAYTRETLSKLEEKPWFPRRKVIAGGIGALVVTYLSRLFGIEVDSGWLAIIDGVAAGFVGWLIPERSAS